MDLVTDAFYARHAAAIAAGEEAAQSSLSRHFDAVFPQPGRVLDVGAGSGRDMAELARRGHQAYGLEPSAALRALAAQRHPALADRIRDASLPELGTPFADQVPPGGFDGLVCSAVLMHVPSAELNAALASMRRQLRAGGRWLMCWPEMAPQRLNAGRDPDGRVFENHAPHRLIAAVEALGAQRLGQVVNDAVLANTGTRWHVAWFEVTQAGTA